MTIFLVTAFAGFSQPPLAGNKKNDTACMCVTPQEMRNALRANDSLQVAKKEIAVAGTIINEMTRGLNKADSTIKKQDELHLSDRRIIDNIDMQNLNYSRQVTASLDVISYLQKQLKTAKNKTLLIGGMSVGVIAALVIGIIKR